MSGAHLTCLVSAMTNPQSEDGEAVGVCYADIYTDKRWIHLTGWVGDMFVAVVHWPDHPDDGQVLWLMQMTLDLNYERLL